MSRNQHVNKPLVVLLLTMMFSNLAYAEGLTYSPDQWPRRWNMLINNMHHDENRGNGRSYNRSYNKHKRVRSDLNGSRPARSPSWGVPPETKPRSRRSLRPDYNTNSHIVNYSGLTNMYGMYGMYGTTYPGFAGYGLGSPYATPFLIPGISPILAPGLAAPGIPYGVQPFGYYPYANTYPYHGILPGIGY